MYNLIKSVISAGGYKLSDIQYKAKKMYLMGDITEKEFDDLMSLATSGINSDAERPETLAMIKSLSDRIDAIEKRLAGDNTENNDGGSECEDWKPWDGISNKYQPGDIVSHNGETWESIFNGQNVWEPGTLGTESLWKKVG